MSDPNTNSTHTQHTRETHVERKGSGGMGALSFIVGGLVVAVGILAFVFWGGGAPDTGGNASGDDVSISVEGGEGGEGGTAAAEGEAGSGGDSAGAAAEAEGGSGGGGSTASDSASGGGAEAEAGATAETEN
ncbi:hypothetical protein [Roseivivax sediminis]|uniref:Uncharacterized protein n=1 Tax=Roseivivax sediminis TaxID=936889 RepID=A0A1I2DJY3_9RHOB|nr:hypothetical protein [Roseivivax sediminis]SFE80826.1 hypothetical protein SAMN04515678_11734 [Roseivivax sediminis]